MCHWRRPLCSAKLERSRPTESGGWCSVWVVVLRVFEFLSVPPVYNAASPGVLLCKGMARASFEARHVPNQPR